MLGTSLWYRSSTTIQNNPSSFNVESVLPPAAPKSTQNQKLNTASLNEFNGKDGKKCYVAIDTTVYEIQQGRLWNNGLHDTSRGYARCGKDLTEVIKKSPHGRSKLKELPKVGTFSA